MYTQENHVSIPGFALHNGGRAVGIFANDTAPPRKLGAILPLLIKGASVKGWKSRPLPCEFLCSLLRSGSAPNVVALPTMSVSKTLISSWTSMSAKYHG